MSSVETQIPSIPSKTLEASSWVDWLQAKSAEGAVLETQTAYPRVSNSGRVYQWDVVPRSKNGRDENYERQPLSEFFKSFKEQLDDQYHSNSDALKGITPEQFKDLKNELNTLYSKRYKNKNCVSRAWNKLLDSIHHLFEKCCCGCIKPSELDANYFELKSSVKELKKAASNLTEPTAGDTPIPEKPLQERLTDLFGKLINAASDDKKGIKELKSQLKSLKQEEEYQKYRNEFLVNNLFVDPNASKKVYKNPTDLTIAFSGWHRILTKEEALEIPEVRECLSETVNVGIAAINSALSSGGQVLIVKTKDPEDPTKKQMAFSELKKPRFYRILPDGTIESVKSKNGFEEKKQGTIEFTVDTFSKVAPEDTWKADLANSLSFRAKGLSFYQQLVMKSVLDAVRAGLPDLMHERTFHTTPSTKNLKNTKNETPKAEKTLTKLLSRKKISHVDDAAAAQEKIPSGKKVKIKSEKN